ncbi:phosphotransferase family protein [Parahaliea sp. F7430]|uniref:Phosphotransferase family protein n=1 Tax=Sediminihaliea albiluteola TaxID=2758564 RepID=A0A7W2YIW5_9GAMM|nr:choline/ethanolamine kinase family protein [Sediminihaliea albiluteola]MBA6412926.1 phosphotransferase family protein [Sediminihaliea albiluteola]
MKRLEQVLAQWQHWATTASERPRLAYRLGAGLSNINFLAKSGDAAWVIRLDGFQPAINRLNRQSEWHVLQAASAQGLAPTPRYFNPELGALVCDYLKPDPDPPSSLADIAGLLRRIHQLPALHQRLDLGKRIAHYEDLCAKNAPEKLGELSPLTLQVQSVIQICEAQLGTLHVCHNDLLAANRLYSGGRLWALDWEYCAMGDPLFDLAALSCGDELGLPASEELLQLYLGRAATGREQQSLARYRVLYRYLELLWHASLSPDSLDWQSKLAALIKEFDTL